MAFLQRQYGFLPNRFSKTRSRFHFWHEHAHRGPRAHTHTCTQTLAKNADSHCEWDLCCIMCCSQSNETKPRPQKCSLCPKDPEFNNRHTGCEISEQIFVFSDNWTHSITPSSATWALSIAWKWIVMKMILFHLRLIPDNTQIALVKHSYRCILDIVLNFMNGGSMPCISLSTKTCTLTL